MKIGIDIRAILFTRAGIRTYVQELVTHMASISDDDFYLFGPARSSEEWGLVSRHIREVTAWLPLCNRRLERFWEDRLLPRAIKKESLDIFHGPRFFVPANLSCPSVVTVHDLGFKKFPEFVEKGASAYFDEMTRASVERARKIIAPSQATKKDLIELYGVPDAKIAVIHEGADEAFSPVVDKTAIERVKSKFSIRKRFILFAGTIEPRKNIAGLLEAYRMSKVRDEFDLVIAGGYGWLYGGILEKARQPDLAGKVIFTNYLSSRDLACLYSGCEVFVFPSFYEGFGLPVLEAMKCGAAVITSDRSSLKELFADSSYQVDPHDPRSIAEGIDRVLSDAALRDELRTKGNKRSKDFSWEAAARQTLQTYKEAIV